MPDKCSGSIPCASRDDSASRQPTPVQGAPCRTTSTSAGSKLPATSWALLFFEPLNSFVPQRHHRIDPHSPPCRHPARQESNNKNKKERSGKCPRVTRLHA